MSDAPTPAPNKNLTILFAVLFGVSELLAQIPSIQSSSIFQLLYNSLKTLTGQ
jgi:hypothetical protein